MHTLATQPTRFPINRRHQGLATGFYSDKGLLRREEFPINRRHQGLATAIHHLLSCGYFFGRFPINRRHQGLATKYYHHRNHPTEEFPINRRHQGLATLPANLRSSPTNPSFQSIGVTKDWRLTNSMVAGKKELKVFPINRRHQGLATRLPMQQGLSEDPRKFPINRRHQGLATRLSRLPDFPCSKQVSNQ